MELNRRDAPTYEAQRPIWDSRRDGYHQPTPPTSQFQSQPRVESRPELPLSNYWDEEGSDSDVSRTFDPREPVNRIVSPVAAPRQLPQISSPRVLSSLDDVQARLNELEQTEDYNDQKLKRLEDKRRRKDERIARRRVMEDEKIKSVYDARIRKDERIRNRRRREDDTFKLADKQLGLEGVELRRRLRSLKRGLPVEEGRQDGGSAVSISPPMPQYQIGPPPPKRHQSGPPGQNDSPVPPQARPSQASPGISQYHYYQPPPSNSPYSVPYHHAPQASHGPYHASPPTLQSSISAASVSSPRVGTTPVESQPPRLNGFSTPSPALQKVPPPSGPIDTRPPPPTNASVSAPSYDTRPPPPIVGFTSVNAGQAQPSGFATVNPRGHAYATTPPKPVKEHVTAKGEARRGSGKSPKSTTPITVGGLPLNKRTPSTTHPYQMSEAFANRHHHCEREDELRRGIWTSHGYMGSRDVPTGPPVEMYLRCNHDDCKRIDWRTVHGLQCHIVKNHEQPKGTIGSLEKALAIYGVPVRDIEDYEKIHGLGSAGQMADPKNQKIKNKTKEAMQKSESPASGDISTPALTPSASYTSNATPLGGPLFPPTPSKAPDNIVEHKNSWRDLGTFATRAGSSDHQSSGSEAPARPNNSFVAVRNSWSSYIPPTAPARIKEHPASTTPPRPDVQSSAATAQAIVPVKEQDTTQLTTNAHSETVPSTATANEISKSTPDTEQDVQPAARLVPPPDTVAESTVTPTLQALGAPIAPVESQTEILKEEPKMEEPEANTTSTQTKVAEDLSGNTTEPKSSDPEPVLQVAVPSAQPPATPGRRPSRRESVSLSKSTPKEEPSMQSPKMSKAEYKRAGRRASVAVSVASVSANASIDGQDGDGEKSGDEREKAAEKESVKGTTGPRRAGRFAKKGR